ncbi:unnamed protein product [Trichogramma brassicae]|uniref:Uncharacterized protein n=1 Tax=Trichogramma brassicae TaxID=86971 RepID=A0A6H5I1V1_9HYME|nr:unnamed protein product [Trichogramma brassicae]
MTIGMCEFESNLKTPQLRWRSGERRETGRGGEVDRPTDRPHRVAGRSAAARRLQQDRVLVRAPRLSRLHAQQKAVRDQEEAAAAATAAATTATAATATTDADAVAASAAIAAAATDSCTDRGGGFGGFHVQCGLKVREELPSSMSALKFVDTSEFGIIIRRIVQILSFALTHIAEKRNSNNGNKASDAVQPPTNVTNPPTPEVLSTNVDHPSTVSMPAANQRYLSRYSPNDVVLAKRPRVYSYFWPAKIKEVRSDGTYVIYFLLARDNEEVTSEEDVKAFTQEEIVSAAECLPPGLLLDTFIRAVQIGLTGV